MWQKVVTGLKSIQITLGFVSKKGHHWGTVPWEPWNQINSSVVCLRLSSGRCYQLCAGPSVGRGGCTRWCPCTQSCHAACPLWSHPPWVSSAVPAHSSDTAPGIPGRVLSCPHLRSCCLFSCHVLWKVVEKVVVITRDARAHPCVRTCQGKVGPHSTGLIVM